MLRLSCLALGIVLLSSTLATAAKYELKQIDEAPPSDELSASLVEKLSPQALRVQEGSEPLCDIWLRKEWDVKDDFQPTAEMLYPFKLGQLLGVIRYHTEGEDFRGQEIEEGVYTLRYGLQPVDGNHIGTSETRDFLLLLPAAEDEEAGAPDEETLVYKSTLASGTTHPALLPFVRVEKNGKNDTIQHDEDRDYWIVRTSGKAVQGDESSDLPVEFVVVGQSEL